MDRSVLKLLFCLLTLKIGECICLQIDSLSQLLGFLHLQQRVALTRLVKKMSLIPRIAVKMGHGEDDDGENGGDGDGNDGGEAGDGGDAPLDGDENGDGCPDLDGEWHLSNAPAAGLDAAQLPAPSVGQAALNLGYRKSANPFTSGIHPISMLSNNALHVASAIILSPLEHIQSAPLSPRKLIIVLEYLHIAFFNSSEGDISASIC